MVKDDEMIDKVLEKSTPVNIDRVQKDVIEDKVRDILDKRLNLIVENPDENFFSKRLNIAPIVMVYIFVDLEKEFQIEVNDRFIDCLPAITLNNLVDAISECS